MERFMDPQTPPPSSPKKSPALLIGVIIVIILAISAFYLFAQNKSKTTNIVPAKNQNNSMEELSPTEAAMSPVPSEAVSQSAQATEQTIAVEGGSYYFNPNVIRVKKGQKITINFSNAGGTHDFVIDEFNVSTKVVQSGQKDSVTFTPDRIGTFEFYCSVGQHRQMGMKGSLIVE